MNFDINWKGPTIAEIAEAAGVGTATVDRVLNGRDSVRDITRRKVMEALDALRGGDAQADGASAGPKIAFLSDSGRSFNRTLESAVTAFVAKRTDIRCSFDSVITSDVDPVKFAQTIERTAETADGLIVVARENLLINRVLRSIAARGVPIVCLTTDLPNSGRSAYVGNDQVSAGATSAHLMGRLVGSKTGKILLVVSAPYRVQEEREIGFRRVLRSEFAHLDIDDRVNSNDDAEFSFKNVMKYIAEHGAPAGVYNTAAGNIGIGRALRESELAGKTVFIGHELNSNSRMLLETGLMDIVIGHNVDEEVNAAIEHIVARLNGQQPSSMTFTKVCIHTKFNCI